MESFAILIDYENFACPPEGLQRFIADFSKRGAIVVKRAYADWVKHATHRQELLANQVEMIELPCASKGKNSVDIRLVVDAMELVFTKPYVASFVIASADADYLPLLSRLREYNKRTIVVSHNANAHRYMRTHCDEFINGDVYLTSARKMTKLTTASPSESPKFASPKTTLPKTTLPKTTLPKTTPSKTQVPTSDQLAEIQTLLLEAWQTHGLERPFNLSELGTQLKKKNNGLDWKEYGFKALKPMVAHLVTAGFLRIELTNGSNERIFLVTRESHKRPSSVASTVSSQACSIHAIDNEADGKRELVSMMNSLVHESIRWDNLRALLLQTQPILFSDLQSDDAFLKLLQSMETVGAIELRYDLTQRSYFVARPRDNRSPTSRATEVEANANAVKAYGGTRSEVWTQPGLF